jgi:hypothetical protein
MNKLLILLLAFGLLGCFDTQVKENKPVCDRQIFNPVAGEIETFICLGETIEWEGDKFHLLAEAVHPESNALIAFFGLTEKCEVDVVGIYLSYEGVYYMNGILSPAEAYEIITNTEAELETELLKRMKPKADPNRFWRENAC